MKRDAGELRDEDALPPDVLWERWTEVDALLERLLDLPAEDWEAHVAATSSLEPQLATFVLTLAREERESDQAELIPGAGVLKAALASEVGVQVDDSHSMLGTRVGAYALRGVLGAGGMGTVFEAERADGTFDRTVAVKVLRHSVASRDVIARFSLERQILASLNHPSIGQLLDGGVTEDGRPYLVMELVDGVQILEWADRKSLDVDRRLRLILGVMEAVEYAHRHMVVHRDLKPGNILVRSDGSVKLLDFGIARLLDDSSTGVPETRPGGRFMTPEYAAPEQLLGEPASAQMDVYSIGIVLYELLTGTRPYGSAGAKGVLEQVVEGAEPTAPSAALRALGPSGSAGLGALAGHVTRGGDHEALRRRLRGDIDAILMRALRARPSERYPSVTAFRQDIERHLSGRPVVARGDTRAYRLQKFIARNRWGVAAVAGVFLLTAGGALGLAVQRDRLIEQRGLADEAAATALEEAETARATTDFLTGLFEASDPDERFGDTLTARAVLERGVDRVRSTTTTPPAVRADLLETLGRVHLSLGLFEEGAELLESVVVLVRDSVAAREGLAAAQLGLARAHVATRDHEHAREWQRAAVASALVERDIDTEVDARFALARTLTFLNEVEEAEVEFTRGLALAPARTRESEEYLRAQTALAGIVRRRGDLLTADSLLAMVVEGRREIRGSAVEYSSALNDLAIVRRLRGLPGEASTLYHEALDTLDLVLGTSHPTTLMTRGNHATALMDQQRFDEALAEYQTSVAAARQAWPSGHWRTADLLMQLGGTLLRADRSGEALEPLAEAVDLAIVHIGGLHSWTNIYRGWLGAALIRAGQIERGEEFLAMCYTGLSSYEDLPNDRNALSRLRALVSVMGTHGLDAQAEKFAPLLEGSDPAP